MTPENEADLADRAVEVLAEEWTEQGGRPTALLEPMARFVRDTMRKAGE